MRADGSLADDEGSGDLAVGLALCHERGHLAFAWGQATKGLLRGLAWRERGGTMGHLRTRRWEVDGYGLERIEKRTRQNQRWMIYSSAGSFLIPGEAVAYQQLPALVPATEWFRPSCRLGRH